MTMADDAFHLKCSFKGYFSVSLLFLPHLLSAVLTHFPGSSQKYNVVSCSDFTLKLARLFLLPSLPASLPVQSFITLDRNLLILNLNIFMETLYLLIPTYV